MPNLKQFGTLIFAGLILLAGSCKTDQKESDMNNPLLSEFTTPFGVPPFDEIKLEHFAPAMRKAMSEHTQEINAIIDSKEEPDFENTVLALERAGATLDRVSAVFFNLNSSLTGPEMQQIAQELSPELSAHRDNILLNDKLFQRIKEVYNQKESMEPGSEEMRLLEETYKYFVRGGANLDPEAKERLKTINEELSLLTLKFGQNVLSEINNFKLVIENEEDLSGLPSGAIENAAALASASDQEGKWIFTVQKPSMIPFLSYADNRELREDLYKGYINLANNENEHDNKALIEKIVNLRAQRAELLGYKTHSHYILDNNMAGNPERVYEFLDKVWKPGLEMAKKEAEDLQKIILASGEDFELEPWDWWYYTEKLRKEKYDLDEKSLSEYFVLENVRDGAFLVATKLYGLSFEEKTDVPGYHEEVQVFEVKDADGSHLGILYMDFYPRESKRSGAWMSEYRGQKVLNGENIRPVVTTNFNFTKPTADAPALLTVDEVLTTFHEFGHALHGLLSQCKYGSLSGTSVTRDFVELPSQIMENWALEPEVLKTYATHYKTGEIIPAEFIKKLEASRHFNQGFATTEYLAASFLDLDYHTLTPGNADIEVSEFEKNSLNKIGLIEDIEARYRSTYFNHIFSGGYSSGYYSYIWAEILDSDAFQAFKEKGDLFDPETAMAFRKNILEKGGTNEAMDLYLAFRGKEPGIEPLLKKRGLMYK